jgi:hypothetical protein
VDAEEVLRVAHFMAGFDFVAAAGVEGCGLVFFDPVGDDRGFPAAALSARRCAASASRSAFLFAAWALLTALRLTFTGSLISTLPPPLTSILPSSLGFRTSGDRSTLTART